MDNDPDPKLRLTTTADALMLSLARAYPIPDDAATVIDLHIQKKRQPDGSVRTVFTKK